MKNKKDYKRIILDAVKGNPDYNTKILERVRSEMTPVTYYKYRNQLLNFDRKLKKKKCNNKLYLCTPDNVDLLLEKLDINRGKIERKEDLNIIIDHTKDIQREAISPFINQMPKIIDYAIAHPNLNKDTIFQFSHDLRKNVSEETGSPLPPKYLLSKVSYLPFYERRLLEPDSISSPILAAEKDELWKDFLKHHVSFYPNPADLWTKFKKINESFWQLDFKFSKLIEDLIEYELNLPLKYPLIRNSVSFDLVDLLCTATYHYIKYDEKEATFLIKRDFLDDPPTIEIVKKPTPSLIYKRMGRSYVWIETEKTYILNKSASYGFKNDINKKIADLVGKARSSPYSQMAADIIQLLQQAEKLHHKLQINLKKHLHKKVFPEICPFNIQS